MHSRLFSSSALKKIFGTNERHQNNFFKSSFKINFELCTQQKFRNRQHHQKNFFSRSFLKKISLRKVSNDIKEGFDFFCIKESLEIPSKIFSFKKKFAIKSHIVKKIIKIAIFSLMEVHTMMKANEPRNSSSVGVKRTTTTLMEFEK